MDKIEPVTVETSIPGVRAFTQPPADFSPSSASEEDLIRYGFPMRPQIPELRALWNEIAPEKTNRIIPTFKVTNRTHHRNPPKDKPVEEGSAAVSAPAGTNWSGIVILDHVNHPFANWGNMIVGRWNVPSVSCSAGSAGSCASSHWVGIDGYYDNTSDSGHGLLQAGTEADINCPEGNGTYYAWYEWYPLLPTEVQIPNFPLNPGDLVNVTVGPYLGDISHGYISVTNITQNSVGYSLVIAPSPEVYLIGYSAEWIVERPGLPDGSFAVLADYSQMTMMNCYALDYLGRTGPVNVYAPNVAPTGQISNLQIINDSGQVVSVATVAPGPTPPAGANIPNVNIDFKYV